MSNDSFIERKLEQFWGMRLGEASSLPNWLFLDGLEYMEVQSEVDYLAQKQLESEVKNVNRH